MGLGTPRMARGCSDLECRGRMGVGASGQMVAAAGGANRAAAAEKGPPRGLLSPPQGKLLLPGEWGWAFALILGPSGDMPNSFLTKGAPDLEGPKCVAQAAAPHRPVCELGSSALAAPCPTSPTGRSPGQVTSQ